MRGARVETCIENFRRHAVQVRELVRDYPRRVRSDRGRVDADRPIGVVELGLFGGGEIPIADNVVKVRNRSRSSSGSDSSQAR
jgi:hypothetical protein